MCINLPIIWCNTETILVQIGYLTNQVWLHLFYKTIPIIFQLQSSDMVSLKSVKDLKAHEKKYEHRVVLNFSYLLPFFWQLSLPSLLWQKFGDSTLANLFKANGWTFSKLLFLLHLHISSVCVISGYIKWLH